MKHLLKAALCLALLLCLTVVLSVPAMAATATGTRTYTISYDSTNGYALNGSDGSHYTIGKPLTQNITTFTAPMSDVTIKVTAASGNIQIGTSTSTGTEYHGFSGKNYTFSLTSGTYVISNVKLKSVHRNLTMDVNNNSKTCTINWDRNTYYEVEQIEVTLIPSSYSVSYVLNGGVNAASNAASYSNDQGLTLAEPTRPGYAFDGWYENASFSGSAVTGIPAGSEGNKTFYAKWKDAIPGLIYDEANGWFVIDSASALNTLAAYSASNSCGGMTFKQSADIALSGNFTGIGSYDHRFSGTYDGGNHYITGLYKKQYVNYLGLFLMTKYATIENVRLVSPYVDSSDTAGTHAGTGVGGLIGSADYTTVRNCYVLDPTLKGEGGTTGAIIGWKLNGNVYDSFYYSGTESLPAVGRNGGSGTTRLRRLILSDHVSADGDGVTLNYGGAIYCAEGGVITLTIDPGKGYVLSALSVKQGETDVEVSGEGNTRSFTMPAGDVTVTATISRPNYTITYNLGGGTNPAGNPAQYHVDSDTITLAAPTRPGYGFEGWTGSNGNTPQKTVTIPHGSTGDKTYTANWLADHWGIALGNDGSAEHPYEISNAEGLNLLAEYVNSGKNAGGLKFVQTADITLSGTFTPIGGQNGGYNATAFAGTYDGGGHAISGLNVNANSPYAGLFGYIQNGTVRNVTVIDPNIRASYSNTRYAGGIVGNMKPGYLENCRVINPTLSATYGGAICGGICARSSSITDYCYYAAGNAPAVGMNNLNVPISGNRVYKLTLGDDITASATPALSLGGTDYYTEGTTVTLGHSEATSGYAFNYAAKDANNGGVTVTNDQFAMPAKDVTVTAAYTPIVYSITYHVDNDAAFSTTHNSYTVQDAAITLDQPSRTGYTFVGWYDNAGFTGNPITAITAGSTGNVELWAKLRANTCTIHFEANHESAMGTMADQTFTFNDTAKALTANAFYMNTGTWLRWNTKADGSGTDYADGAELRNLTAEDGKVITLYAQWRVQHRFNYDSSIFRCNVAGHENEVYWAYEGETVQAQIIDSTHQYTVTIVTADGSEINYSNSAFTMPDQEVWITTTSLTKMAYTTILLDSFESYDDVAYLYDAAHPTVTPAVTVKHGDTTLTENTDYTLAITNNIGSPDRMVEATVTVTAVDGSVYVGANTTTFRITPFNIADCEIRGDLEIIDDGYGGLYPLMEKVQVWNGNNQLTGETLEHSGDVDFTVEIDYSEAYPAPGEYTARVLGRGDWYGTKAFTFTVVEPYHTVVFDANGGTGTMANGIVTKTNDIMGYTYTLPACTFVAPHGFEFDHWEASCEPGVEKQPGHYFTAPYIWSEEDVTTITVTACWRGKDQRTVTVSGLEHGSLLLNGEAAGLTNGVLSSIYGGDQITIVPDAGYELSTLTVTDAANQSVIVQNGAFTIPESNVTVSVTIQPVNYGIVIGASEHGVISAPATAPYAGTVTVTVTPEQGYTVSGVQYNGNDATKADDTHFTFAMPVGGVTISAAYTQLDYTLAATGLAHGALWVNGDPVELPATVHCGDLVEVVTEKYYEVGTLSVTDANGASVTVTNNRFTMPAGSATVAATLTPIPTYAVNVVDYATGGAVEHGTVTPSQTVAAAGEIITLTVMPDTGFTLDTGVNRLFATYRNGQGGEDTVQSFDREALSFTMPAGEVKVRAQFLSPWEQLQQKLSQGGQIVLDRDYAAAETDYELYIPQNTTVTLDLNGHTLDASATDYNVLSVYGALTMNDSRGGGRITGGKGAGAGVRIVRNGSFIMNGGAISGNAATGEYDAGGAVYVNPGSTFTMNGGTITGNSAPQGGGVYTFGTFTMNGGAITGNTATGGNGGGVMAFSDFTLSGAARVDGNGPDDVTLVYFEDEGEIYFDAKVLVGGSLTGAAQHPIAVRYSIDGDEPETLTFTSGLSGRGTAACFTSADSDYAVRLNGEGEAKLVRRYAVNIDGSITGGSVTASTESAYEDESVTLTVTPAAGYELSSLTVTDANGASVTVQNGSFTMPASDVTVSATFGALPFGTPTFKLPAAIKTIEESAFEGLPMTIVEIPSGCQSIGKWAFKNCTGLTHIRIPASVTAIDTTAFEGCTNVLIYGTAGSAAQTFCDTHTNCTFVAET